MITKSLPWPMIINNSQLFAAFKLVSHGRTALSRWEKSLATWDYNAAFMSTTAMIKKWKRDSILT